jgi:hypothetical protein
MTAMPTPASSPGSALRDLLEVLELAPGSGIALGNWRWTVRQRLAGVRDVLIREYDVSEDGWLSARRGAMLRERTSLLMRISDLGPRVLEEPDVGTIRHELQRLLGDVSHHLQRLRDLAYDDV